MSCRGFIFSLDAFVAFTLTMVTISFLIFTIGAPLPYYNSLEQAHQLAHDTLQALAYSTDAPGNPTYLEQMLATPAPDIMYRVAGGSGYKPIIPKGYGYRLEAYDFETGVWEPLYDTSTDGGSDRSDKRFTKVQASSMLLASLYPEGSKPKPGMSPFCYVTCHGYNGIDNNGNGIPGNCMTPCDIVTSNFYAGSNSIQLVRLTVYT